MKTAYFWMVMASMAASACSPAGIAMSSASTVGVTAMQERSAGDAVDDSAIRIELNHLFLQKDFNDLFRNVTINVIEGRVMLTGNVDKPETALEAVRLAWKPAGVREVLNELVVNDKISIGNYTSDALIANSIRGKLLLEDGVRSVNYNVEAVNQVVYLFGVARSQAELDKVTYIASITSGVKEVVSHIVMANDPRRHMYAPQGEPYSTVPQNQSSHPLNAPRAGADLSPQHNW